MFRCRARMFLLAGCLLASAASLAIDLNSFESQLERAREKVARSDFAGARADFEQLLREAPRHPRLQLGMAQSLVGLGLTREAEGVYEDIVAEGFGAALSGDPTFLSIKDRLRDPSLVTRAGEQAAPIARGVQAFSIPERGFIAEGLAFDPNTGRFFVGSTYLRKIVVHESDGRVVEFVPSGDHGLLQVLGMKVDEKRGRLVVLTGEDDARLVNYEPGDRGRSAVFTYDLATGRYLDAAWLRTPGVHLFNDLVLTPDGAAYLTDSDEGRIYHWSADGNALEPVTPAGTFLYPNGIDLDASNHRLFVADFRGIFTVDLHDGKVARLPEAKSVSSVAIDGLYLHGNALIGVQSIDDLDRVMSFRLSPEQDRIEAAEPLERADPRVDRPTEGVVVGNRLYFIARSFQDAVDDQGVIAALERAGPTTVLSVPLIPEPTNAQRRHIWQPLVR